MITVDNLLLKIANSTSPTMEELLPRNDGRILRSLSISVSSNFFITENQSRLLTKILKEHSKKLSKIVDDIDQVLEDQMWSKRFRLIEQVRKLYIEKNSEHEPCLVIEFTFNSKIRKILSSLTKNLECLIQKNPGKIYEVELTEKNIVTLVDVLTPLDFEIDDDVKNYYDTIKSWSKQDILDQFLITNIVNPNFQKHIIADLGADTALDKLIIKDRSVRYQYTLEKDEKLPNTLAEHIAYRTQPRLWVDKKENSLDSVFESLIELRRLPIMVVFDTGNETLMLKNLELLDIVLKKTQLTNNVGIYFRLPNTETGKLFNSIIADNNYNKRLDSTTEIVVVQNGKIPKFFLNSTWRPMSIVILDSVTRHGKTSVYSNYCDLILEYANEPALKDMIIKW